MERFFRPLLLLPFFFLIPFGKNPSSSKCIPLFFSLLPRFRLLSTGHFVFLLFLYMSRYPIFCLHYFSLLLSFFTLPRDFTTPSSCVCSSTWNLSLVGEEGIQRVLPLLFRSLLDSTAEALYTFYWSQKSYLKIFVIVTHINVFKVTNYYNKETISY